MGIDPCSDAAGTLEVLVVYSAGSRDVRACVLTVPEGTNVADAVSRSELLKGQPPATLDALKVTVWGRKSGLHQAVRTGDRIEILRPLKVDPKTARRERFVKQGAKSAGLFAHKRSGGKAGY